ncbi:MAG: response regulator [Cyanobacteria bacterium J083]|nr:MAG: response regulator [Cyanobacteria bacterium J083]
MKTILVVDDIQAELDLMAEYLTQAGYQTINTTDGEDAIAKSLEYKPDAIITDLMMPKVGGLDICRKLKKNPATADIPIIACSAKNRDVDRMWAIRQGVKAYVTKPFAPDELVNTVKAIIG